MAELVDAWDLKSHDLESCGFDSRCLYLNSDGNKIANQTKSICVNAIAVRGRNGMSCRWKSVLQPGLHESRKVRSTLTARCSINPADLSVKFKLSNAQMVLLAFDSTAVLAINNEQKELYE